MVVSSIKVNQNVPRQTVRFHHPGPSSASFVPVAALWFSPPPPHSPPRPCTCRVVSSCSSCFRLVAMDQSVGFVVVVAVVFWLSLKDVYCVVEKTRAEFSWCGGSDSQTNVFLTRAHAHTHTHRARMLTHAREHTHTHTHGIIIDHRP